MARNSSGEQITRSTKEERRRGHEEWKLDWILQKKAVSVCNAATLVYGLVHFNQQVIE
jgi:hypothetical protein